MIGKTVTTLFFIFQFDLRFPVFFLRLSRNGNSTGSLVARSLNDAREIQGVDGEPQTVDGQPPRRRRGASSPLARECRF
jgi:hypothetical protein